LAEQARLDFDAGKAEALRGEARHFLVGQAGAHRQALEALGLFQQRLKRLRSLGSISTSLPSSSMVSSRSRSAWTA
jgi:hypothetical protein